MKINVLEYLRTTVEYFPDKIAIRDRNGDFSFTQLEKAACVLGKKIHEEFGGNKSPVAVFLPKSRESIVSFFAALISGNFYVRFWKI